MPIRRRTILLVLTLLAPSATAAPFSPEMPSWLRPDPERPMLVYVVPCLALDVEAGGQRLNETLAPELCNWPKVSVEWRASGSGGRGAVSFAFDTQALDPRDAPTIGVHASNARGTGEPLPEAPRASVVVTARFDVAWGGDCSDARGTFSASVNDAPARVDAPRDLFRALCRASTERPDDLARAVVDAALAIGDALVPAVPTPDFAPILAGLATLLPPADAPAPLQPSLLTPPSGEEEAAGSATVAALTQAWLANASYDALLSTPAGRAEVAGGLGVGAPSPTATAAGAPAASGARENAPPVVPTAAASPAPALAPPAGGDPAAAPRVAPASSDDREPPTRPPDAAPPRPPLARAAAAVLAAGVLLAALVALHHRVARGDALRHPTRAALARALADAGRPASVAQLAAAVGIPRKTAEYHLLYLARLGILREDAPAGGSRRFALPTHPKHAPPASLERALLDRIRETPGASAGELGEALGVSRLRVDRRVKALLLSGRLRSRVEDGRRRLYLA